MSLGAGHPESWGIHVLQMAGVHVMETGSKDD